MLKTIPWLPVILAISLFMESIDTTVIVTALPAIASDLNTNPLSLKIALIAYLLALVIFMPISGWLADRLTARYVFCGAMLIFIIGSIFCAISFSLSFFIFARFLQGFGGALIMPLSRLLLLRLTSKKQQASALTWLTIPASAGPLLGPPIGGLITHFWSWHWIFLINIPIGIIGLFLTYRSLPRKEKKIKRALDWKGFFFTTFGLSSLIIGLSIVNFENIHKSIAWSLVFVGLIFSALYVLHAKKTPQPLLNLNIFLDSTFRQMMSASSFFRLSTSTVTFLLPLMLQLCFHLNPLHTGLITFINAAGILAVKLNSNFLYKKFSLNTILTTSAFLSVFTTAALGFFTAQTPYFIMFIILFLGGFFRALCLNGSHSQAFVNLPKNYLKDATSIFTALQQVAFTFGLSFAGLFLEIRQEIGGNKLSLWDFHLAFFSFSLFCLIAAFLFMFPPKERKLK